MTGKVISFCSYKGGAGRTTTAVNVAYHLALNNKEVVIVDLDVDGPGIGSILDIEDNFIEQKGLPNYFDENVETNSIKEQIITTEISQDSDDKCIEIDILGCSMNSESTILSTDEGAALNKNFRKMINELREIYDYIILDAASGISSLSIIAFTNSDIVTACFRWSKQHVTGALKMLKVIIHILEDDDYPLTNFIPVANAVADPQTPKEKLRMDLVVETIEEQLSKRLATYSKEKSFVVPKIQYVWEVNDLKFEDRIVVNLGEGGYSDYFELTKYLLKITK